MLRNKNALWHAFSWKDPRWLIFHSELEIIKECGSGSNVFDVAHTVIGTSEQGLCLNRQTKQKR